MPTRAIRDIDSRRQYWSRNIGSWMLALLLCLFSIVVLAEFGYQRGYELLYLQTKNDAENELEKQSLLLESYLEKYRLLPVLMSRQSRFVRETSFTNQSSLKTWIQQLSYLSGSHDVLLLNKQGDILLSARQDPERYPTFAGSELIIAPNQARLGRGYIYLDSDTQLYGFSTELTLQDSDPVIFLFVVDLDRVKQSWALSRSIVIASDDNDFVVLSSDESLVQKQKQSDRFRNHPDYAPAQKRLDSLGWTIEAFQRLDLQPLKQRTLLTSLLICLGILIFFTVIIHRREKHIKQELRDRLYAQELEAQINFRTAELVSTNRYLSDEITERKLAEKHLELKHKELVHSAKLATIGQMSTTLSHEYNQPLAAMRTYAENAQKLLDLGKLEPVRDNLSRIMHQADRMGQLSKTLLSFAGKPNEPMGPIDVTSAVQEARLLIQARLNKSGIQFDSDIAEGITLKGHSLQFSQVLVNLLTNAMDAISQNLNAKGHIHLSVIAEQSNAILVIEDNGPGVENEILDQLFEPFVSTKSSGKGLGLGLSIIRDIVHDHQGQLTLSESSLGGAAFKIQWPLWEAITGNDS